MNDFRNWNYSSYGAILTERRMPVKRTEVIKWFGNREEYVSLHNQWVSDAQAKWFVDSDFD